MIGRLCSSHERDPEETPHHFLFCPCSRDFGCRTVCLYITDATQDPGMRCWIHNCTSRGLLKESPALFFARVPISNNRPGNDLRGDTNSMMLELRDIFHCDPSEVHCTQGEGLTL